MAVDVLFILAKPNTPQYSPFVAFYDSLFFPTHSILQKYLLIEIWIENQETGLWKGLCDMKYLYLR